MPSGSFDSPARSRRRPTGTLLAGGLVALSAGCAALGPPESVVELSREQEAYYQDLRPALRAGQDAFRESAAALERAKAALAENRLIEESLARREEIYRSVARDLGSAGGVGGAARKAVEDLVKTDQQIQEQVRTFAAASEVRRKAVLDAFDVLGRSLQNLIENERMILAHLESRAALPPLTNVQDAVRALKDTTKRLQEQFQLAREIAEEARRQFRGVTTGADGR